MELNEITLLGNKYVNIETIDGIAVADSFVHNRNKLDSRGNGEAKLYVGSRKFLKVFFLDK